MINKELDWSQILTRKVANIPLTEERSTNIDISVTIGNRCETPMFCDSAFILEMCEDLCFQPNELLQDDNFICSYKKMANAFPIFNKRCMLDIDGDTLDVSLLKRSTIGAFFISLNSAYSSFSKSENQHYHRILYGAKLPVCPSQKGIVDVRKILDFKYFTVEWIYSIRQLRTDIPFGIRIPANFIEQDLVLAMFCEVDFVIFDCTDTVMQGDSITPQVPSLATIIRAVKILTQLNCDIKIIIRTPNMLSGDYFKLFALGVSLVLIKDPDRQFNDHSHFTELDLKRICELKEKARAQLKNDIHECGSTKLSEVSKKNLLTTSTMIRDLTNIPTVTDSDSVLLPLYHMRSNSKMKKLGF
ncbi:MAG: hypothetical protein K0M50_03445 [Prolixibacteraceae bacterium]|nr:hypothetical protein [Prolixibacteraceae bacterium]